MIGLSRRLRVVLFAHILLLAAGTARAQLNNVSVSIADRHAGASTSYIFTFSTNSIIPSDGRILFYFPSGFNVSSASVASTNLDGTFSTSNAGNTLYVQRNGDGSSAPVGQMSVELTPVTNSTSALPYSITLETRTSTNSVIESGSGSFEILFEDQVVSFSIICSTTQTAGTGFTLRIEDAVDQYGNSWSGTSWVYVASGGGDSPDGYSPALSDIYVSNGSGEDTQRLYNAAATVIELSVGHFEQQTSTITVLPGPLGRFEISNEPSSVNAGISMSGPVTVTAFDEYGNIKTDYSGTAVWNSTDTAPFPALLPSDDGTGWSGGRKDFAGSGFTLYNGPSQTIGVTDQTDASATGTSDPITVQSHPDIADYTLSVPAGYTQTAGQPFALSMTGILDQYGNDWAGSKTASVSVFSGGGDSPDSHTPQLQDISLSTSSGTADQILVNAVPTVLITSVDGIERYSSPLVVRPGALYDFTVSASSPQTAGVPFSLSVASAVDTMANPWSGDVTVTVQSPAVFNAPDGTPPSLNNITVQQGTGSASQTLTLTGQTILQGSAQLLSRTTGAVIVEPGALYEFTVSGEPQQVTAGQAFTSDITVTAYDGYRNIKTDFSGPVTWSSSDPHTQTVPSDDGSGWSGGIKDFSGSGFALYRGPSQAFTVQSGSVSKVSSSIIVLPGDIAGFDLSCGRSQVAGVPFNLIVTNAQDQYGNSWEGTVTVSGHTGAGNSPSGASPVFNDIQVDNGTGESAQTMVNAEQGAVLQGRVNAVIDTVENIDVSPNMQAASLSRLVIRDQAGGAGSPVYTEDVQVGESLNMFAAGYDPYGNFRQDESVAWSSGGFNPPFSQADASNVTFTPDVVGQGYIQIYDGVTGVSGRTGTITVHPGPADTFDIAVIATQVAEEPFQISVSALDDRGNTATDFTGTVDISDGTGSISPLQSGAFDAGTWTGYVTISNAAVTGTEITVQETGASDPAPYGVSNTFNVLEPDSPRIRVLSMEHMRADYATTTNSATAGQDVDWIIKTVVENSGQIDASLDSIRIEIFVNNTQQTDYVLMEPDTFFAGGTNLIRAGTTDSLIVTVDETGITTGMAIVQGAIYLRNTTTGKPITDQGVSTITVNSPADVRIAQVSPSQQQVTQGQTSDWTVAVTLENSGGSRVSIDPQALGLSFSIGEQWDVELPPLYTGTDWILEGNTAETLTFVVDTSGVNAQGTCTIHTDVPWTELNTGRTATAGTAGGTPGTIELERPGNLFILSMGPSIRVNTGQTFMLPVTIQNSGDDGVHDIVVQLLSNAQAPAFPSSFPATTEIEHLDGGEEKTIQIEILAAYTRNSGEEFVAQLAGYTDNDTTYITSDNSSKVVVIDDPAQLAVASVSASVQQVQGGQVDPWNITVVVENRGGAPVLMQKPSITDLQFSINTIQQNDYVVSPPAGFDTDAQRTIMGGQSVTMIYTVNSTGRLGGSLSISAESAGTDLNNNAALEASGTVSSPVTVVAEKDFRIIATALNTPNKTDAGNGSVNTGQDFYVDVVVENGLGRSVKNVELTLTSTGSSISGGLIQTIAGLSPTEFTEVSFLITASQTENLEGELFYAEITNANYENTTMVPPVGASLDSTALVFIETPASLNFSVSLYDTTGRALENVVSTNQVFNVVAEIVNHGTAAIDGSGQMQISLPTGYELVSAGTKQQAGVGVPITWQVKAPNDAAPASELYIRLSDFPREVNTGNYAVVEEQIHNIPITTIKSWIRTSISINNPPGAKDNVISSGQLFWIRADLTWSNCKNLIAELSLPAGYTTQDDMQKSVLSNYVVWPVKAPAQVSGPDVFRITANGQDQLQDVIVNGDADYLYVSTVMRADLSLGLDIVSPVDATDGSVSIGQEFVIEASLSNNGDAEVLGTASVSLKTDESGNLPGGYTTRDALVKEVVNGTASWTITAPEHISGDAVPIEALLQEIPYDENTNEASYVSRSSNSIAVTTAGASLAVSAGELPSGQGNIVVPGDRNVVMMVLLCENVGIEGANPILVSRLKFVIEDDAGNLIRASRIFKSLYVIDIEQPDLVFGRTSDFGSDDTVRVVLNQIDREPAVRTESSRSLAICAQIDENTSEEFFQLNFPDNRAVVAEDIDSGIQVPVQSPFEENWVDMRSQMKRVLFPDQGVTLCNCPNPFGDPSNSQTRFIYYLEESSDVSFMIFTLTGQLVWKDEYSAASPQGASGMHDTDANSVIWTGLNQRGNRVLNGVYLLVMKTGTGTIEKTKIAVVK